uniref:Solute carrier family 35 member D3 n=1 Tax=Strix occidentalis caurina TaxID=311401 RepID=A0A8D0F4Y8_STROC
MGATVAQLGYVQSYRGRCKFRGQLQPYGARGPTCLHFQPRCRWDGRQSWLCTVRQHSWVGGCPREQSTGGSAGRLSLICPAQTGALFLSHMQKPCLFLSVTLPTGAGDLTGDAMGYVTGVLAVLIHAAYLVLIQKTSVDSEYGPLTAQYAIAVSATPFLIICSFASMDSINVWSFPGWKDPAMVCIFIACVLISCAMNFTTLHCTYINSAVTTSFVGVVKSIATITVGMVAFNDVEPTKLFIAGVVVNTLGSVIYCVAKYIETRRQSNYEDLEKEAREEEGKRQAGDQALFAMESISQEKGAEEVAVEGSATGDSQSGEEEKVGTEKPAKGPKVQGKAAGTQEVNRSSLKDAYLGVWRLVRGANYIKKDYLIENEELPNP